MTKRIETGIIKKDSVTMDSITINELLGREDVNREYLLYPFLKQRQPIMIYSKTGLGKSWYTLSIALTIAGGGEFAGYNASKPSKVAYFDGEMSLEDLKERIKSLIDILYLDKDLVNQNFNLLARTHQQIKKTLPDLNSEDESEMIIDFVNDNNIELAIFDNYSTLVTSIEDENNASSFSNVMNLLQELSKSNCASILVHHANKSNSSSSYRGSSKMAVLMESIIKLDENPNGRFDEVSFKVVFEKFRQKNTTETIERILTLNDTAWIAEEDLENQSSKIVDMVKSLNYIMDKEIQDKIGLGQSSFSKLKKKIIARGLITADEWKGYLQKASSLKDMNDFDEDILDNDDF